jgi:hypothetical protein
MAVYKYIVTIMANMSSLVTLFIFYFHHILFCLLTTHVFLGCGKTLYIFITKASHYTFKKNYLTLLFLPNCFILLYLVV